MLKKCPKCGCEGVWSFGFVTIKNESKKGINASLVSTSLQEILLENIQKR